MELVAAERCGLECLQLSRRAAAFLEIGQALTCKLRSNRPATVSRQLRLDLRRRRRLRPSASLRAAPAPRAPSAARGLARAGVRCGGTRDETAVTVVCDEKGRYCSLPTFSSPAIHA